MVANGTRTMLLLLRERDCYVAAHHRERGTLQQPRQSSRTFSVASTEPSRQTIEGGL